MAANIKVMCPNKECNYSTSLRFDPGPEDEWPELAREELKNEHPKHTNFSWAFIKKIMDERLANG